MVATPIGNLGDITLRARAVLAAVDAVICEDSRVTGRLLRRLGIERPLLVYHEHNAARVRPRLLARLSRGDTLALVADAGTPCIADPGYKLVREALSRGVPVRAVPGPCAAITALSVCGLPTDRFLFQGFLPSRRSARRRTLGELARVPATLVLYEAPHRLRATLADCLELLGDREACIARELTKRFEELRHGRLRDLLAACDGEPAPRGEIVLVLGPPAAPAPAEEEALRDALRDALARRSLRDAVAEVAAVTGVPRSRVYRLALELGEDGAG